MKGEIENEELISKLANLVREYQQEMERKETDIVQMKKLLCSYEAAIQDLQKEKNGLYGNRGGDLQASRS